MIAALLLFSLAMAQDVEEDDPVTLDELAEKVAALVVQVEDLTDEISPAEEPARTEDTTDTGVENEPAPVPAPVPDGS